MITTVKSSLGSSFANPGANASVRIFDESSMANRIALSISAFSDVAVTLKQYWAADANAYLRVVDEIAYNPGTVTRATRTITVVAVADLVNNDRIAVTDGISTVTFEYKVDGTFVAVANRTTIDVSELTTDVEVAVATAAAISASVLKITAPEPADADVVCTADYSGTSLTIGITENVANAGYTISALTAGADGDTYYDIFRLRPGRNVFDIVTTTAPTEFEVSADVVNDAAGTSVA